MNAPKEKITVEQLDAMMTPGKYVHTFIQAENGALVGADRERSTLLASAIRWGAELAGDAATAMKHGAVVHSASFPMFVETIPAQP